jgi:hypothetical protein
LLTDRSVSYAKNFEAVSDTLRAPIRKRVFSIFIPLELCDLAVVGNRSPLFVLRERRTRVVAIIGVLGLIAWLAIAGADG